MEKIPMMLSRRKFLLAPAVVCAANLMPVRSIARLFAPRIIFVDPLHEAPDTFQSIQAAYDWAMKNMPLGGEEVTIQIKSGVYLSEAVCVNFPANMSLDITGRSFVELKDSILGYDTTNRKKVLITARDQSMVDISRSTIISRNGGRCFYAGAT